MITAWYDGKCAICQSACGLARKLDWHGRVEFRDLHAAPALPEERLEALLGEIHLIDGEGALYTGFQATRRLLQELPAAYPLWLLLGLPGMDGMGRRAYRFVAARRYRLNKLLGRELPECAAGCQCGP